MRDVTSIVSCNLIQLILEKESLLDNITVVPIVGTSLDTTQKKLCKLDKSSTAKKSC